MLDFIFYFIFFVFRGVFFWFVNLWCGVPEGLQSAGEAKMERARLPVGRVRGMCGGVRAKHGREGSVKEWSRRRWWMMNEREECEKWGDQQKVQEVLLHYDGDDPLPVP